MFSRMLCSAATIFPAGKEPLPRPLAVVESALGGLPLRSRQTLALGELPVLFYPRIVELAGWEADVAAHAGRAAVRGGVEKIPREARNR